MPKNYIKTATQSTAVELVLTERKRQDAKWGQQNHAPVEWLAILGEEYGEVAKEICESHWHPEHPDYIQRLMRYRKECIEVAAVALAMIESVDRNELRQRE